MWLLLGAVIHGQLGAWESISHSSTCSLLLYCLSSFEPRSATFSDSLTLRSRTCRQVYELIRTSGAGNMPSASARDAEDGSHQLQILPNSIEYSTFASTFDVCKSCL